MAEKIYCPVCYELITPEEGDKNIEGDKKLLLYREPNSTPSTCCTNCFDQIQAAHNRLIKNMRWTGRQNREFKKRQKEALKNAAKEEKLLAIAQSVVT